MDLLQACWYVARLLIIGSLGVVIIVAGIGYVADKARTVRNGMEVSEGMP